mmetsp:Transcript_33420/g.45741  ORF Transcript_33420/g.45741 Transcript_33420/m.45741 type:complete len:132 (+) Transcript_33420:83-478(+)
MDSFLGACERGDLEQVQTDLKNGRDIEERTEANETAIHYATAFRQWKVLEYLLEQGANPSPQSKYLRTPLHYAAKRGSMEGVKLLLQYNADSTLVDEQGNTPADDALKKNHQEIYDYLQAHSAITIKPAKR